MGLSNINQGFSSGGSGELYWNGRLIDGGSLARYMEDGNASGVAAVLRMDQGKAQAIMEELDFGGGDLNVDKLNSANRYGSLAYEQSGHAAAGEEDAAKFLDNAYDKYYPKDEQAAMQGSVDRLGQQAWGPAPTEVTAGTQAAINYSDLQAQQGLDSTRRSMASQQNQQLGQLGMFGGVQSGARERMASRNAGQNINATQNWRANMQKNRLDLTSRDLQNQQNRQNKLQESMPGMHAGTMQPKLDWMQMNVGWDAARRGAKAQKDIYQ